MNLKSFGCSFIFGTDLSDIADNSIEASNHTWPALLSQYLGYNYECQARPGAGNIQIAERVLSHAVNSDSSLFVINWTWIDRFDYTGLTITNEPLGSKWLNWKTVMPTDETPLANTYYKELHSEFRDKLTTLMSIRLVIDTLNSKGIKFIMTHVDDLMFDQRWHTTPAVLDLQEYIKPYMTTFDGQNFLTWSRSHGYPEGPGSHPLEDAHKAVADYVFNIFDKQKTNALIQRVLS